MKTLATIAITGLMIFSPLACAQNASQAKVDQLMTIMDIKKLFNASMDAMMPVIDQQAQQLGLNSTEKAELTQIYKDWLEQDLDQDYIFRQLGNIYAEAYTDAEMDALIQFYQSPVGQKSLRIMPEIMAKSSQLGMQEAQSKQQQLLNRLQPFFQKHQSK